MKNPFVANQKGEQIQLCHLDDVQAPDELPSHVELGVGRPVGEGFEPLPNLLVRENVKGAEGNAVAAQDLHHLLAEAWKRELNGFLTQLSHLKTAFFSPASSKQLWLLFFALSTASNNIKGKKKKNLIAGKKMANPI